MSSRLPLAALLVVPLLIVSTIAALAGTPRDRALPPLILWAWEQPQDLRFVDPRDAGVAFLAATLVLHGDGITTAPRMQPLETSPGVALVAVVRIEARGAAYSGRQRRLAAEAIARLARLPRLHGVQVDFDAPRSARAFYRALLADVRRALPDSLGLGMTALASWGLGDPWLTGLPVDEAVPMVFRMGADDTRVREALGHGTDFTPALCRRDIGVALDEPWPAIAPGRRIWVFYSGPWSPAAYAAARRRCGAAG